MGSLVPEQVEGYGYGRVGIKSEGVPLSGNLDVWHNSGLSPIGMAASEQTESSNSECQRRDQHLATW